VFGGGGGVIIPSELKELHAYGVSRLYSPEDGQTMGLQGMIDDIMQRVASGSRGPQVRAAAEVASGDRLQLSRLISALENNLVDEAGKTQCRCWVLPERGARVNHR
jgi:methylmalonyl-CoA mutase